MLKFVKSLAIVAVLSLVVAPISVPKTTEGDSQVSPLGGPGGGIRP